MANLIRQTILQEGTKYATIHWYFESDGNEGELKDKVILDLQNDFKDPLPYQFDREGLKKPPKITIRQAWFSTAWFDMILGFESVTNDRYVTLARDTDFDLEFKQFGGIFDNTPYEAAPTGNLTLTTRDFAPLGSSGFLVLEIKKD